MNYVVLILIFISVQCVLAQPKSKATTTRKPAAAKPKPAATPTPAPMSEKEQFEKASSPELAVDRVAGLEKFLAAFPESENRTAAVDLLTSSRALIAEEKLISGNGGDAVAIFRQVVEQAPQPIPNDLFNESIAKIPSMLFRYDQRAAAFELANLIESKIEANPAQLLEIANFYINIENGGEAMRVAAKAAAKDPASAAVYRTLALAHRINFDLESSATAYAKALELEPDSPSAKRGLAEMKRALGKSDEALSLYRELLSKNEADIPARTGVVLALFESGKRTEAEAELAAALEKTPGNFLLLAGAAYWYASRGIGDKAVELAEKALAREPRYVWSHIALARGLIAKGRPAQAEQVLFRARAYGNFPTLEYELASARVAAGFYREAAEDLSRQFSIAEGGVRTSLGGRVNRVEKTLTDLVAYERRASIFAPNGAESAEAAETLRALLELDQKLRAPVPNEAEVVAAVDAFVKGTDKMKVHRQLYAANLLLQKRAALPKVLELTKSATGNTDAALDVPDAGAAVMATELYDSRAEAFRKNEVLLVPDVPRPTLSAILRGRLEELTGWALYQQGNYPDAVIRLRRAITVIPDKSAWWRSSMWRLGAALAADGKDAEALNAYIESYKTDKPDFAKYAVVESLYRKVNGSTDGLEAKIGVERVAVLQPLPEVKPAPTPETPAAGTVDASQATPVTTEPPVVSDPKVEPAKPPVETRVEPKIETKIETKPEASVETSEPEKRAPAVTIPIASTELPVTNQNVKTESPVTNPIVKTDPPVAEDPKPDAVQPSRPITESAKPVFETAKPVEEPAKSAEETPKRVEETPKRVEETPERVGETPRPVEETPKRVEETAKRTENTQKPVEELEKPVIEPQRPAAETKPPDLPPQKTETKTRISSESPPTPADSNNRVSGGAKGTKVAKPITSETRAAAIRPLFEPIIITIPSRIQRDAGKSTEEKKDDTGAATRPRSIDEQDIKANVPPCEIGLSQDRVSLINDGGTVGILVGLVGPGDIKTLTATSNSPKDVTAILEPEIGGMPEKRFFVIKSTSSSLGVYQITFAATCGKKDLVVTVR